MKAIVLLFKIFQLKIFSIKEKNNVNAEKSPKALSFTKLAIQ